MVLERNVCGAPFFSPLQPAPLWLFFPPAGCATTPLLSPFSQPAETKRLGLTQAQHRTDGPLMLSVTVGKTIFFPPIDPLNLVLEYAEL